MLSLEGISAPVTAFSETSLPTPATTPEQPVRFAQAPPHNNFSKIAVSINFVQTEPAKILPALAR